MGELEKKILEKIKEEKIVPRPRWQFLLKDYSIWTAFFVSVVVGGAAFCVALSIAVNNDWDIYRYLSVSPSKHILISLPYLWIILLFLFLWLAFYNYKHTKSGYKHCAFVVLGLSVAGSLLLGYAFHTVGMGRKIDRIFARNIPFYQEMQCCSNRKDVWDQPEKGLLGGRILQVRMEDGFDLEDFQGVVWQVEKDGQVFMRDPVLMRVGEGVKLIGEKRAEQHFWAREIRHWDGWEDDE
jgi:hypothetical protein